MTQKERIEKLEREVADLRLLVEAYRAMQPFAQPAPFVPYTPPTQPWVSPNTWPAPAYPYTTCDSSQPAARNLSLVV